MPLAYLVVTKSATIDQQCHTATNTWLYVIVRVGRTQYELRCSWYRCSFTITTTPTETSIHDGERELMVGLLARELTGSL